MIVELEGVLDLLDKEHIARLLRGIAGPDNVKTDELMKDHTSFKVGGPADILVTPDSIRQLEKILKICSEYEVPLFVMGNGSNLVVRDKGIRGVVVKIYDNFNQYKVQGDTIEAQAGILLSQISNAALENELTGLEFASGIPGTLGGAVTMNAGAYGPEMKDVVVLTEYMDLKGNVKTVEGKQHEFAYRTSFIQKEGGIVLSSRLKLVKGNKSGIKALMDDLNKRRRDSQPLEMPSAGSVFRRPAGYYTGQLIQNCGLKGWRIGGAEISNKHCGFIVNAGDAAAEDIIRLIKHIQDTVKERFGVELQTEVKIVGEE